VLRPPIAQERLERRPDGLVRITLKRPYADGTVAVDMDPLSLLCRLATSVPPPRHHTVKYSGVLASACRWRSRIAPPPPPETVEKNKPDDEPKPRRWGGYRFWAELLARTFARREALQEGFLVEALANAVDPPPAKRDVDRLRGRDARLVRRLLEDLDPDFFLLIVTLRKPRLERSLARERADLFRIHEHGVFLLEPTSPFSSRRLGCSR
jgi:hypothetical protein